MHWFSKNSSLLIGTKKGGIYHSIIDPTKRLVAEDGNLAAEKQRDEDLDRWTEIESNQYKTKYPIYSMAVMSPERATEPSSVDDTFLFCGSGDRWISVWNLGTANGNVEFVQKLGPHTGWVKDLVYDTKSLLLHSIGCNCIETWDCSSPSSITHAAKRAIENSPTMGTTLSSDLLCLCLLPSGSPRLLVTGGVDGRIHLWFSDPKSGKIPLHTILAHDGRVNAIVYSSATKSLFTAGNDGSLCVFSASLQHGFEFVSRLRLNDDPNQESLRITVASIMNDSEEQGTCSLALGSSTGELYSVEAKVNAEGGIDSCVTGESMTIAENSMVYSIACEKASSRLWIGHASGLATLDVYS